MTEQYIHIKYHDKALTPTPNAWQMPNSQYTTYYVEQANGSFALLDMDMPPNLRPFLAIEHTVNHIQLLRPDIDEDMVESYFYDVDREALHRTPHIQQSDDVSLQVVVFFATSISIASLHSKDIPLDILQSLVPSPSCVREDIGQGDAMSLWHFTLDSLTDLNCNDMANGTLVVRRLTAVFDTKHLCLRSQHDSVGIIMPQTSMISNQNLNKTASRFSYGKIKKTEQKIDAGTMLQIMHYQPEPLPKILYQSTIINDLKRDGFSVILPTKEKRRVTIPESPATESFVSIKKQILEPVKALNPQISDALLRHFVECVVPQSNVMAFIPSYLLLHIIGLSINHIEFSETGVAQCFSRTGILHEQTNRSIDVTDEEDIDEAEGLLQQAITTAQKLNTKTDYPINTVHMSDTVMLSSLTLQETLLTCLVEKTFQKAGITPPASGLHLISIVGQAYMVIKDGLLTLTEPFFVLKYDVSYNIQDFADRFSPGPDECPRQKILFSDTLLLDLLSYYDTRAIHNAIAFIQQRAGKKTVLEVHATTATDIATITALMIQNLAYDRISYFDAPERLKTATYLAMFPCEPWTVQRFINQVAEPIIHIIHGEMSTHKLLTTSYMKKSPQEMTVFIISTTSPTLFQSIPVGVFLEPANEQGQQDTLNALISGHIRAENAGLVKSDVAKHIAFCHYAFFEKHGDSWELSRQSATHDDYSSPIHTIGQQLCAKLIDSYGEQALPWAPYLQHIVEPIYQLKKSFSHNNLMKTVTEFGTQVQHFAERMQDLVNQVWVKLEATIYITEINRRFFSGAKSICIGSDDQILAEILANQCKSAYSLDGWDYECIQQLVDTRKTVEADQKIVLIS